MADSIKANVEDFKVNIYYPDQAEQTRTGFTKAVIDEFLKCLQGGMSMVDCCSLFALNVEVVKQWYYTNKYNFKAAVDQASTYNKLAHVNRVQSSKDKLKIDSSKWWLERKYKNEYSKEVNITVNNVLIDGTAKALLYAITKNIKDPDVIEAIKRDFREQMQKVKQENRTDEQTPTLIYENE